MGLYLKSEKDNIIDGLKEINEIVIDHLCKHD